VGDQVHTLNRRLVALELARRDADPERLPGFIPARSAESLMRRVQGRLAAAGPAGADPCDLALMAWTDAHREHGGDALQHLSNRELADLSRLLTLEFPDA
jgi:hypothetical protein